MGRKSRAKRERRAAGAAVFRIGAALNDACLHHCGAPLVELSPSLVDRLVTSGLVKREDVEVLRSEGCTWYCEKCRSFNSQWESV